MQGQVKTSLIKFYEENWKISFDNNIYYTRSRRTLNFNT